MSEIRANTISDAAGTGPIDLHKQSAAKAWARFDMSSATLNDSLNIGSLTDNGTGDFTLNFSNNMASGNYTHVGSGSTTSNTTSVMITSTLKDGSPSYLSASSFRGEAYYVNSTNNRNNFDYNYVTGVFHGDLA